MVQSGQPEVSFLCANYTIDIWYHGNITKNGIDLTIKGMGDK